MIETMRRIWFGLLVAIAMLAAGLGSAVVAGPHGTESGISHVVIATRVLPPFVLKEANDYTGFSPELWKAIAQDIGVTYEWKEVSNVKDILAAVQSGDAHVAIGAISITSEREAIFDFSQPMFESGLQIMVRDDGDGGFSIANLMRILSSGALPIMLGLLAALVLIPAHVVWLAERKHGNPLFSLNYFPGIFHAMWWAVGAAAGQQPDIPRSGLGRFLSAVSILISVIFMAFFTATLTASITVGQLQGGIRGPNDLQGKLVGTTRGSTSAKYLSDRAVQPIEYDKSDAAIVDLENHRLDAVVMDSPVLLYYAANEGKGKVHVVGPVFRHENYGIVFPSGSGLRKRVNAAILKMREDGRYDKLYERWFTAGGSG